MKWVDLTDALFCQAFGHFFAIIKPAFRNDVVKWSCMNADNVIVAEGGTVSITAAKSYCKEIYAQIKAADNAIYVKKNGKLTRRRYATSKAA